MLNIIITGADQGVLESLVKFKLISIKFLCTGGPLYSFLWLHIDFISIRQCQLHDLNITI